MVQIAAALIILYLGFPLIVMIFTGIFEAFITFVVFAFKVISSCISFFQNLFNSLPPESQAGKSEIKINKNLLSEVVSTMNIETEINIGTASSVTTGNDTDNNWRIIGTIRHNKNCRYFTNKYAISCTSNTGVACKICGG